MSRQPYILIAEDDIDDIFLLDAAFKENKSPVKLSFVQDGVQVLKHLGAIDQGHPLPNLIILDLNMPLMNGIETLKILKEHERFKKIPVIIYSTSESQAEKDKCLQIGAAQYIHKEPLFDQVVSTAKYIYEFALGKGNFDGLDVARLT